MAAKILTYTYIKKNFFCKTFDSFFYVLYMIWFFFLFFAAKYGYKDIVQILLENGAKVDHQDVGRYTALIYAGK